MENVEYLLTSVEYNVNSSIPKFTGGMLLNESLDSNVSRSLSFSYNSSVGLPKSVSFYPSRHLVINGNDAGVVKKVTGSVSFKNLTKCSR